MIKEHPASSYLAYHHYLLKESLFGYIYRRFLLYPLLRSITGPIFLDVGCGKGIFLKYGNPRLCLGLDVNPHNVSYVSTLGLRAELIDSIDPFPVSEGSFPACVIDQVLEHVVDPSHLLKECYRALAPGGILIVGLPCEKGFAADPDHKVPYTYYTLYSSVMANHDYEYVRHFFFPFNSRRLGRLFAFNYLYVLFRKPS